MEFSEYQHKAWDTAMYPEHGTGSKLALAYVGLKLNGEAGEIAEKIGKFLRSGADQLTPEQIENLKLEMGDVLWYLAGLCTELKVEFAEIAPMNIQKLADRKDRGVVHGYGDHR